MFDQSHRLTRRGVLAGAGAVTAVLVTSGVSGAAAIAAPAEAGSAFTRSTVADIARALSKAPFKPPPSDLPPEIADLTYDQYRAIYFKPEAGLWANEGLPFQLQFFHRGFYFKDQIDIAIVADGRGRSICPTRRPCSLRKDAIVRSRCRRRTSALPACASTAAINRPDYYDEVVVFQGASYFRSLGKGQIYGISARGLALKTAEPEGEEFPIFRSFWVETPVKDSDSLVVHALLDSPSVDRRLPLHDPAGDADGHGRRGRRSSRASTWPRSVSRRERACSIFSANGRDGVDDWRPRSTIPTAC